MTKGQDQPLPITVIYLDVDGAISALSSTHGFGDGRTFRLDGFRLTLSQRLGIRLRSLDAEIRWLTTWAEQANEVGARMGLPTLPLAAPPPAGATSSGPWKLDIVRKQVEEERRPFVWIDDDAIGRQAEAWASSCGVPSLLLRPKPHRGLTPADLDAIEHFIAEPNGSGAR
jgi:hypothetical protein